MARQDLAVAKESIDHRYQSQTGSELGTNKYAGHVYSFSGHQMMVVDYLNPNLIYLGYADIGSATSNAVWLIKRVSIVSSVATFEFADGDDSFDNIWDNRAALSYV